MQTKFLIYIVIGILVIAGVATAGYYSYPILLKRFVEPVGPPVLPAPFEEKGYLITGNLVCTATDEDMRDLHERVKKVGEDIKVEIDIQEISVPGCPRGLLALRIVAPTEEDCSKVREILGDLDYIKHFSECKKIIEVPPEQLEQKVQAP